LPRLIGFGRAAEVIQKGKLYSAHEALKLGLVDEVVPRDRLVDLARKKLSGGKRKLPSPYPLPQEEADGRPAGEGKDIKSLSASGNPAPARAVEVMKAGLTSSVDQSLARELDTIVDLGNTESTRNLIRNFFLAEKYKRGTSHTTAAKVVHAAVIGAGIMGSGIAQWLSSRGVTVILRDVGREELDRGLANIENV
jgi:enoyl-CoA hydratase/carnithine racemase